MDHLTWKQKIARKDSHGPCCKFFIPFDFASGGIARCDITGATFNLTNPGYATAHMVTGSFASAAAPAAPTTPGNISVSAASNILVVKFGICSGSATSSNLTFGSVTGVGIVGSRAESYVDVDDSHYAEIAAPDVVGTEKDFWAIYADATTSSKYYNHTVSGEWQTRDLKTAASPAGLFPAVFPNLIGFGLNGAGIIAGYSFADGIPTTIETDLNFFMRQVSIGHKVSPAAWKDLE